MITPAKPIEEKIVTLNRRQTILVISGLAVASPLTLVAEQPIAFDPIAVAKLRAGEIARDIQASPRDASRPEPSQDKIFEAGLLLQAGLRALLPVAEREGVALPGEPSEKDPTPLVEAQENYKAVFKSGTPATPVQEAIAVGAIIGAVRDLRAAGYVEFSKSVRDWLRKSGHKM